MMKLIVEQFLLLTRVNLVSEYFADIILGKKLYLNMI